MVGGREPANRPRGRFGCPPSRARSPPLLFTISNTNERWHSGVREGCVREFRTDVRKVRVSFFNSWNWGRVVLRLRIFGNHVNLVV